MAHQIEDAKKILQRTPDILKILLHDLPEAFIRSNEGGDSWSPYDIVGHLIHGEDTDWIPRTQHILEFGTSKPFQPFDRFAQFERFKGKSIDELLELFAQLREKNLNELTNFKLSPSQLELKGVHPDFKEVTLKQLLSAWVVHDLNHIYQIVKVIAKQYADEVGPFKQYLAILNR